MQKSRFIYPISLGEDEVEALNIIIQKLGCSKAEAIRMAIKAHAEEVKGLEVVKLRNIGREEAKKEILQYLKKYEHAWSSNIADSLRIDIHLVNELLEELWTEEKVEPTD